MPAPEALRALETVRHALVKEAIDLTEALQQVAPAEVVGRSPPAGRPGARRPRAVTRMVHATRTSTEGRRQVPWGLVVLLVLAGRRAAATTGIAT